MMSPLRLRCDDVISTFLDHTIQRHWDELHFEKNCSTPLTAKIKRILPGEEKEHVLLCIIFLLGRAGRGCIR